MGENKIIIYLLRVNPDPEGTFDVDGERFRVYEEVDPRYEGIVRGSNITADLLKAFSDKYRLTRDRGEAPHRNLQVIMTELNLDTLG